jgi:hypothetical protein
MVIFFQNHVSLLELVNSLPPLADIVVSMFTLYTFPEPIDVLFTSLISPCRHFRT